eukprot:8160000-Pyramimonas_sp.AAC.1
MSNHRWGSRRPTLLAHTLQTTSHAWGSGARRTVSDSRPVAALRHGLREARLRAHRPWTHSIVVRMCRRTAEMWDAQLVPPSSVAARIRAAIS